MTTNRWLTAVALRRPAIGMRERLLQCGLQHVLRHEALIEFAMTQLVACARNLLACIIMLQVVTQPVDEFIGPLDLDNGIIFPLHFPNTLNNHEDLSPIHCRLRGIRISLRPGIKGTHLHPT